MHSSKGMVGSALASRTTAFTAARFSLFKLFSRHFLDGFMGVRKFDETEKQIRPSKYHLN
jgi:hypothetical protein